MNELKHLIQEVTDLDHLHDNLDKQHIALLEQINNENNKYFQEDLNNAEESLSNCLKLIEKICLIKRRTLAELKNDS